jgi:phosphocarrier protein
MKRFFTLKNKLGLHARVAAMMVKISNKYDSEIIFEKDGREVSSDSILDILTLYCPMGSSIAISANGPDAAEAIQEFEQIIENKFGED